MIRGKPWSVAVSLIANTLLGACSANDEAGHPSDAGAGASNAGSAGSAGMATGGAGGVGGLGLSMLPGRTEGFTRHDTACFLDRAGDVRCRSAGQLGAGVMQAGPFTMLATGYAHICALRPDATVQCWMTNTEDDECSTSENACGQDAAPAGTFRWIAAGRQSSCGIRFDGSIECWGQAFTAPAGTDFVFLDAQDSHFCALGSTGRVACGPSEIPTPPANPDYVGLAVGFRVSCLLLQSGALECYGQTDSREPPLPTEGAVPLTRIDMSGSEALCGLTAEKEIVCYGGEVGALPAPPGPFERVLSGAFFACGVRADDTLSCWGRGFTD